MVNIIGVTGVLGSGKASLCNRLVTMGFGTLKHIDADAEAFQCVASDSPESVELRQQIFSQIGVPNLKQLGDRAFSNSETMKSVISLVMPYVLRRVHRHLESLPEDCDTVLMSTIMLMEDPRWVELCGHKILIVEANEYSMATRMKPRYSEAQIDVRLRSMLCDAARRRLLVETATRAGYGEVLTFDNSIGRANDESLTCLMEGLYAMAEAYA